MDQKELAAALQIWFNQNFTKNKPNKKGFWRSNPVAIVIKSNLEKSENWKKRGIGSDNARYGWDVKEYNRKVKEEGFKGPKPVNLNF